jgi:hypothetical protein
MPSPPEILQKASEEIQRSCTSSTSTLDFTFVLSLISQLPVSLLDTPDLFGETLLCRAAAANNLLVVCHLLAAGASPVEENANYEQPCKLATDETIKREIRKAEQQGNQYIARTVLDSFPLCFHSILITFHSTRNYQKDTTGIGRRG